MKRLGDTNRHKNQKQKEEKKTAKTKSNQQKILSLNLTS